ncbi:MAG TPA: MraY family glycosyltransferase [Candidatus Limnocylindrales bacterium]|nr:MraY family glycosyltransferase [Candidatus Limnocylindrales bacterium]
MPLIVLVAATFGLAAMVAFLATPVAARIARRAGAIDQPGAARRVHRRPIPRAGGLAVAAGFLVVGPAAVALNAATGAVPSIGAIGAPELVALFAGSALAAALGFIDDRFDLRARWQLLVQLALAGVAVAAGVTIDFINNPLGQGRLDFVGPTAVLLTVIWIVGMINSINFIDGLDGLSSGVALIAVVTLGLISWFTLGQAFVALLCAVLAGALAGFLPWNFHPARIFVGTTGVYLIGFALAVLSILGTAKVAVALLVLGVPIIDTFWIIVRRLLQRRSPFTPDRGHLHHRLLDLGLGHRDAVVVIYALCVVLAVLSFGLSGTGQLYAFLGLVLGGGLLLYLLTRRAREALEASSYDDDVPNGAAEGPPDDTARGEASAHRAGV